MEQRDRWCEEELRQIYKILVELLGIHDGDEASFVHHLSNPKVDLTVDWHFGGVLGIVWSFRPVTCEVNYPHQKSRNKEWGLKTHKRLEAKKQEVNEALVRFRKAPASELV